MLNVFISLFARFTKLFPLIFNSNYNTGIKYYHHHCIDFFKMWLSEIKKYTEVPQLEIRYDSGRIWTPQSISSLYWTTAIYYFPFTLFSIHALSYFLMHNSCDLSKLHKEPMNHVFIILLFLNSSDISFIMLCTRKEGPSPLLASVFSIAKWMDK